MKGASRNKTREVETIVEFAKKFSSPAEEYPLSHIDSPQRVRRYVIKAEEIVRYMQNGKVLDWGSGYGQMFFLLQNRGLDVTGCELAEYYRDRTIADLKGSKIIYLEDPVKLPFDDLSFDAVLSCGVLEHVANQEGSLKEVYRVLKKRGWFFIYNLPNKFSWIEFISRHISRTGHERLYGIKKTVKWLDKYGFKVMKSYYECFLPVNLASSGNALRKFVDNPLYNSLNDFLPKIPLLNHLSQNIAIISQKI